MKKLLAALLAGLLTSPLKAGLITHTDYTGGNVITAAGQNTNENTIVNEMNGNLDTANFEDGGIATADLADGAVTQAKLASNIVSTFTVVQQMAAYRRPNLQYVSATTVDIENNSSTQHETCIIFPGGERRCVTENTGSTTQYRRFDITANCTHVTGTEDSGLTGTAEATNTWYALYAVKSQINTAKFVVCGSTRTPTQANFSSLDTMYQTNGWYYLGLVRNGGDGTASTGDIVEFKQDGALTLFLGANNGGSPALTTTGIRLADTGGATSLTYTYAAGTGNTSIPDVVSMAVYVGQIAGVASTHLMQNSAGTRHYHHQTSNSNNSLMRQIMPASEGVKLLAGNNASLAMDIVLSGWMDTVLGVGFNPQI